jgi:hypothetical protein
MVVMPKQWRSIAYLPVATGTLVSQAEGSVLTLAFRPRMPEIAFILAWCGLVVGSGGPIWFGVGVPCLYHVVGSLLCFPREVNRVVSLARWVLAGRVGVPRYEDGAAEQADAADEAQGGTRTAR